MSHVYTKILGIDPDTKHSGFAIIKTDFKTMPTVEQYGLFQMTKDNPWREILDFLLALNNDTLEVYVNLVAQKIHLKDVSNIYFDQYVEYDGSMVDSDPYKTVKSGDYTIKYKMKK